MSEVLRVFTRLGLTSFGGPTAHLGYFRDEFVDKREWLSDDEYADLLQPPPQPPQPHPNPGPLTAWT